MPRQNMRVRGCLSPLDQRLPFQHFSNGALSTFSGQLLNVAQTLLEQVQAHYGRRQRLYLLAFKRNFPWRDELLYCVGIEVSKGTRIPVSWWYLKDVSECAVLSSQCYAA